uniref:Retrotransposon gag domain-containing protein n=1 Tax=Manihot esculenta TaxID=3983 RepID=A0A2C9VZP5_MANES
MNELKGLIMRIQRNESQLSRSKTKEQRESIEASRKFNHPWGSSTKLEFPRFDGERLDGWLLCCEYFFEIGKITPENRNKPNTFSKQNTSTTQNSNSQGNSKRYNQNQKTTRPFLTSKEMDEKGAKNLCYWCDEKYSPGHKCKKRQLYVLQIKEIIEEDEKETMIQEIEGEAEGVQSGCCGKVRLHILIDSGSTHNFINKQTVQKLPYTMEDVNNIWVEIAKSQSGVIKEIKSKWPAMNELL